jgi:hypothetical protein
MALVIFFAGALISVAAGRSFGIYTTKSLILYMWHTAFSLLYCWYVLNYGGDSIRYFLDGQSWSGRFSVGTDAVSAISALLVSGLGLSILGTFLVFNVFGQIGLLAFWGSLKQATIGKALPIRALVTLIIFLPSISFWTSALGKDALSFMATGLALWSSLKISKRGLLMTFSILLMLMVRPHMAGIMILAASAAVLVDGKASIVKKLVLGIVATSAAVALIPFALRYAGVGELVSVEILSEYINQRQKYNTEGGGGVDIASMSLPMQMFTYLFRPMLFEARNLFSLAAAVDNFILLLLFLFGFYSLLHGRKSGLGENRVFMWVYVFGSWLILAMTTANMGIALRQKWMFAPMLIFLLISVIGRRRQVTHNHERQ